ALGVYDRGVAVVFYGVTILSNAVDTGRIAQVFYGPGFKQCVPGIYSRCRPVGNANKQIVRQLSRGKIKAVPAPHRKAEIIANDRANPPPLPCSDEEAFTGSVRPLFVCHSEEMSLVVGARMAAGFHPEETIIVAVMYIAYETTEDEGTRLIRHLAHPFCSAHVHHLGKPRSGHREAGSEHLRQHNDISMTADTPDLLFQHGEIG